MNFPIRWTQEAEESFAGIITHLETNCSEKEVRKFIRKTKQLLNQLAAFPLMYEASNSRSGVRKGFVTKHAHYFIW